MYRSSFLVLMWNFSWFGLRPLLLILAQDTTGITLLAAAFGIILCINGIPYGPRPMQGQGMWCPSAWSTTWAQILVHSASEAMRFLLKNTYIFTDFLFHL